MKIFTPPPLKTLNLFWGFYFRFAPGESVGIFKERTVSNFFETDVEYTDAPEAADAIVLPDNFTRLDAGAESHLREWAEKGERFGVPIYVFSCGDLSATLVFDHRITVFKYSIYRTAMRRNEVSTPTLTEDLGQEGIVLREKSDMPTVSFCGKAGFGSMREKFATYARALGFALRSFIYPAARARIRGVLWRIWSIHALNRSPLVRTLFIIRKTFSGALRTIEVPPEEARADFIRSVTESDFVLATKGDGNYSNRFLEALSMGRIPVVVDTDIALPFEDRISYERIMVRIPMNDVSKTPKHIRKWYDALSREEWLLRQKEARETYERLLRQDQFFRNYFRSRHTQK